MAHWEKDNKKNIKPIKEYDTFERKNVIEHDSCDIKDSIEKAKEYLLKYKDIGMNSVLADKYITIGNFEEANKHLDIVEDFLENNPKVENKNWLNVLKTDYARIRYRYYCSSSNFEEALKFFGDYSDLIIKDYDALSIAKAYIFNELGMGIPNDLKLHYKYQQLANYSFEKFKNHIKSHIVDSEDIENPELNGDSHFYLEFPLDNILDEIKTKFNNFEKCYVGYVNNAYIFKYNNCGVVQNQSTDYFVLITFLNGNFITMYPTRRYMHYPSNDINYLNESLTRTKAKSGLDRFKERYGK